jgi:hypothetical protein
MSANLENKRPVIHVEELFPVRPRHPIGHRQIEARIRSHAPSQHVPAKPIDGRRQMDVALPQWNVSDGRRPDLSEPRRHYFPEPIGVDPVSYYSNLNAANNRTKPLWRLREFLVGLEECAEQLTKVVIVTKELAILTALISLFMRDVIGQLIR